MFMALAVKLVFFVSLPEQGERLAPRCHSISDQMVTRHAARLEPAIPGKTHMVLRLLVLKARGISNPKMLAAGFRFCVIDYMIFNRGCV